jgi:hypothetical protein
VDTVIAATSLKTEFYKMIGEAQARLNVKLNPNVEYHTVQTLAKHGRKLWSLEPIALQILRLAEAKVSAEPEDLEEIGNCILMVITRQMPGTERRGLRKEYFLTWGCFVYEQAGVCAFDTGRRELYRALSDSFHDTAKVVGNIFSHDGNERVRQATTSLTAAKGGPANKIIMH